MDVKGCWTVTSACGSYNLGGSATFMYLMNSVFMPELDKFVVVFIDDILSIVGAPGGPQINNAFSSSISWRSMSVHDDD